MGMARHALCLYHAVFGWMGPAVDDARMRRLRGVWRPRSSQLRPSPRYVCDLRAQVHDEAFAVDASLFHLGASVASLSKELGRELWRCREKQRHYTRLAPAAAAWFRPQGWPAEGDDGLADDLLTTPDTIPLQSALVETFDFIEVVMG